MPEARGILALADPLNGKNCFSELLLRGDALFFDSGRKFLPQAQAALQAARRRYAWLCVAACGNAAGIALALAAQLPVDRIALCLDAPERVRNRELRRIEVFARRNLALVTAEILLLDAQEGDVRRLVRSVGRHTDVRTAQSALLKESDLTAEWR